MTPTDTAYQARHAAWLASCLRLPAYDGIDSQRVRRCCTRARRAFGRLTIGKAGIWPAYYVLRHSGPGRHIRHRNSYRMGSSHHREAPASFPGLARGPPGTSTKFPRRRLFVLNPPPSFRPPRKRGAPGDLERERREWRYPEVPSPPSFFLGPRTLFP